MGLAMPEFPHARILLKPDFNPDEGLILRENMVLAVEPIVCTLDRRKGIPIGDTVVVTEKGPKRLSRRPLELIMV
jgi:Xaa-Pro aminopeptidase